MFASLRARLWLTYALITGVVLSIVGAALMVYLLRNPYETRLAVQRLRLVSVLLSQRGEALERLPATRQLEAVQRADAAFNVRVAVQSPDGDTLVDSRAGTATPLPNLVGRAASNLPLAQSSYRDARRRVWLYAVRPLADGNLLVVAMPRPRIPILAIFRDEFTGPFLQAALLALLLTLLLAVWVSRWISAPLRRISAAARRVAGGAYQPIPLEGPSEVQELAGAFNDMTARVQASQQSQRDFVANVSHELKTPLTSIQGFAQAIMDGTVNTTEGLQQAARVIYTEAGRMHRLVLDLLDLARLDAGIAAIQHEQLDLAELLGQVVEKFTPQAQEAQVALVTELAPLAGFRGDRDRLTQVFTNLLDNALQHTPAGGQVRLRLQPVSGQAEVSVTDSGPGIPADELGRIFERFYQVDKARPGGRGRGAGLGLAIARDIVQAHGGSLTARNNDPPPGSSFTVRLPLAQ
jgi:two-component system OmpR family sensor kinase